MAKRSKPRPPEPSRQTDSATPRMIGAFLLVAPLVLSGCAFSRSVPPSSPTSILDQVDYGYVRDDWNSAKPLALTQSDLTSVLGALRSARKVPLPEGNCPPRMSRGAILVLATKHGGELDIAGMFTCDIVSRAGQDALSTEYVLATPSEGAPWAYDSPYLAQFVVQEEQLLLSADG